MEHTFKKSSYLEFEEYHPDHMKYSDQADVLTIKFQNNPNLYHYGPTNKGKSPKIHFINLQKLDIDARSSEKRTVSGTLKYSPGSYFYHNVRNVHPYTKEEKKSINNMNNTEIQFGLAVKDLGNGKVGGYGVLFTTKSDPDLVGDYFTTDSEFKSGNETDYPVYYCHTLDKVLDNRELGRGQFVKQDEVGLWFEAQLNLRDEYEQMIYKLAKQGKLGWSTGSVSHLVRREPSTIKGVNWVKSWPIAEVSLTPMPAEPRTSAVPVKSIDLVKFGTWESEFKSMMHGERAEKLQSELTKKHGEVEYLDHDDTNIYFLKEIPRQTWNTGKLRGWGLNHGYTDSGFGRLGDPNFNKLPSPGFARLEPMEFNPGLPNPESIWNEEVGLVSILPARWKSLDEDSLSVVDSVAILAQPYKMKGDEVNIDESEYPVRPRIKYPKSSKKSIDSKLTGLHSHKKSDLHQALKSKHGDSVHYVDHDQENVYFLVPETESSYMAKSVKPEMLAQLKEIESLMGEIDSVKATYHAPGFNIPTSTESVISTSRTVGVSLNPEVGQVVDSVANIGFGVGLAVAALCLGSMVAQKLKKQPYKTVNGSIKMSDPHFDASTQLEFVPELDFNTDLATDSENYMNHMIQSKYGPDAEYLDHDSDHIYFSPEPELSLDEAKGIRISKGVFIPEASSTISQEIWSTNTPLLGSVCAAALAAYGAGHVANVVVNKIVDRRVNKILGQLDSTKELSFGVRSTQLGLGREFSVTQFGESLDEAGTQFPFTNIAWNVNPLDIAAVYGGYQLGKGIVKKFRSSTDKKSSKSWDQVDIPWVPKDGATTGPLYMYRNSGSSEFTLTGENIPAVSQLIRAGLGVWAIGSIGAQYLDSRKKVLAQPRKKAAKSMNIDADTESLLADPHPVNFHPHIDGEPIMPGKSGHGMRHSELKGLLEGEIADQYGPDVEYIDHDDEGVYCCVPDAKSLRWKTALNDSESVLGGVSNRAFSYNLSSASTDALMAAGIAYFAADIYRLGLKPYFQAKREDKKGISSMDLYGQQALDYPKFRIGFDHGAPDLIDLLAMYGAARLAYSGASIVYNKYKTKKANSTKSLKEVELDETASEVKYLPIHLNGSRMDTGGHPKTGSSVLVGKSVNIQSSMNNRNEFKPTCSLKTEFELCILQTTSLLERLDSLRELRESQNRKSTLNTANLENLKELSFQIENLINRAENVIEPTQTERTASRFNVKELFQDLEEIDSWILELNN